MTIALRYLLSNPSSSQSSCLTSLTNSEETKTMPVEKEDEKDLTRKEEDNSKESQKELKVPANDLEILKRDGAYST